MDKTVMLAVAGSGKTTQIVNGLQDDSRSLIVTYTENNYKNLRKKIINRFGHFPENICLFTYFTFLYTFCFRPFLGRELKPRGINWKTPPEFTYRLSRSNPKYYFDSSRRVYHNRLAKLLDIADILPLINNRIEKYFDNLFIDEIQDFAGNDFDLIKNISKADIQLLFVGDFYQHTYDTSRDANVNSKLHDDLGTYIAKLKDMGLHVDCDTLQRSHRCSPTICQFVSDQLGIKMYSHREDTTVIKFIDTEQEAKRLHECANTIKLFYNESRKYDCFSRNWGESKGEDHYEDVCVVMNKGTFEKFQKNNLQSLNPLTRNKFYVACSRARNRLFLVSDNLYKQVARQEIQ